MKARFSPILFDLDGTLFDTSRDIADSINRTLGARKLPPLPHSRIVGYVGDGARALVERTLRDHPGQDLEAFLRDFKADYRVHCLEHTAPYPGIPALLAALAPTPVGVVTNKTVELAHAVLDAFALTRLLGAVVGGDEAALKPDPAPLLLACRRLGVEPVGGVMVGDFRNDVEAGAAAGMTTCGVLWGFDRGESFRESPPDLRCRTVADLEQMLTQARVTA